MHLLSKWILVCIMFVRLLFGSIWLTPSSSLSLPPSLLRLEWRVGLSRQGPVSRDQLQSREYCLQQGWLLPSLCWNCTTARQLGILFSNIVLKWIWISHTMTAHSQPFNLTLLLSEIQSGIHYHTILCYTLLLLLYFTVLQPLS